MHDFHRDHSFLCLTQASLPAIPHVSASSLRYRAGGSNDGSSSSPAHAAALSPGPGLSPGSARTRQLSRFVVGSPLAVHSSSTSSNPNPGKRPAGWESSLQMSSSNSSSSSSPPPCSVMVEAEGQRVLLPASLVRQYGYFPLVLVQLPMYNEEAHCEVVIERACNMVWPRHRVLIQVRVHQSCLRWQLLMKPGVLPTCGIGCRTCVVYDTTRFVQRLLSSWVQASIPAAAWPAVSECSCRCKAQELASTSWCRTVRRGLRGDIGLHDAASHYPCAINSVCACSRAELCEPVMAWLLMCVFQVCDDSTREDVRRRIDSKVEEMCHRGHQCMVTRRDANKGFKVRLIDDLLMWRSSGVLVLLFSHTCACARPTAVHLHIAQFLQGFHSLTLPRRQPLS